MKKVIVALSLVLLTLTSCVSKKQFAALEAKNKECQDLLNSATVKLNVCLSEKDALAKQAEYLKQNNSELINSSKEMTVLSTKGAQNIEKALETIKDQYDYIIIDCAPSLGLLTLNALTAADSVLIPIQCEYFALEGLGKLLNTIKSVQRIHNADLDIEGLLLTMFDSRLRLSNQVVEEVQKHFNDMVFKTIIQRNVKLSEAPSFGESIINFDATSRGASNYLSLAQEIIKKNSK